MLFETKTQEALLEDLLSLVPDTTNKYEGTLIYSTLAAMAEKMAEIYFDVETATENTYADTADREHLIRIAAERGLSPTPATSAIYKAHFNCDVAIGDRFCAENTDNVLVVIEDKGNHYYLLKTEDTGLAVNKLAGSNLEYVEGDNEEFDEGQIMSLETAAVDEQDTEEFRQAYFDNARAIAFSGNIPAYINAVTNITGVGGAKVVNSGNKIMITIIDEAMSKPSQELVDTVQQIIDPDTDINNWGGEYGLPESISYKTRGYGLAPIDHDVLVLGVSEVDVKVAAKVELETGYAIKDVMQDFTNAVEEYIKSKREAWQHTRQLKLTANEVIAELIKIKGIDYVTEAKINDKTKYVLSYSAIPKRQSMSLIEA